MAIPDIIKNTQFKAENIKLYTFASPRCGDKTFADAFEKTKVEHWRIANTEDMVTMIPFPTGNVFSPGKSPEAPPQEDRLTKTNSVGESIEEDLGTGGVTGVDHNPNPLFGYFKAMYDRNKRRMPDYAHTGTPVYFTINEAALERHHNLHEVYMKGIGENPLS